MTDALKPSAGTAHEALDEIASRKSQQAVSSAPGADSQQFDARVEAAARALAAKASGVGSDAAWKAHIVDVCIVVNALSSSSDSADTLRAENAKLREELARINGGLFVGASNMALSGDWKGMVERLQEIAGDALAARSVLQGEQA